MLWLLNPHFANDDSWWPRLTGMERRNTCIVRDTDNAGGGYTKPKLCKKRFCIGWCEKQIRPSGNRGQILVIKVCVPEFGWFQEAHGLPGGTLSPKVEALGPIIVKYAGGGSEMGVPELSGDICPKGRGPGNSLPMGMKPPLSLSFPATFFCL